jgi:hypothetical protein
MDDNRFGKAFEEDIFERINARNIGHFFLESIIECECHAEILMLPDLKAMSKAIEDHIAEHRKANKYCSKTNSKRLENDLIAQALKKDSQQNCGTQKVTASG